MTNKKKIEAKIITDSTDGRGNRITTYLLTYPRIIHGELMTHRLFSRNSASSRAIPFKTMVKSIEEDPFVPIAWQKDHKGMQGNKYEFDQYYKDQNKWFWLEAMKHSIERAKLMNETNKVTKQLCNRLLEPYAWHTVLVTATEYDNFFDLRCPKLLHQGTGLTYNSLKDWNAVDSEIQYDGLTCMHPDNSSQAEIHIQALAEAMWDAKNESTPVKLKAGEWHIPFGDRIDDIKLEELSWEQKWKYTDTNALSAKIKVSVARCARLSYMTFDGAIDYQKDIELHDILLNSKHFSPFEHCCRIMDDDEYVSFVKGEIDVIEIDEPNNDGKFVVYGKVWSNEPEAGWCDNFKGFISYRYLIQNKRQ